MEQPDLDAAGAAGAAAGVKRPMSPDENRAENVMGASAPSTALKRLRGATGIRQPSARISHRQGQVDVDGVIHTDGDLPVHGSDGVRAPLRVDGVFSTIFADKYAACNALLDRKAVKPKVANKAHIDEFGKFIRELKDALKDLMERQESFRQSCVQLEVYNTREIDNLRKKFEVEVKAQRDHANKYMDKMAAAESALTQSEVRVEQLRAEKETLRAEVDRITRDAAAHIADLEALHGELEAHQEARAAAEAKTAEMLRDIERLKGEVELAQSARDTAQRQVAELQGQMEKHQLLAQQAEQNSKGVREQVDSLTAKIAEKEAALSQALSTFSQTQLANQSRLTSLEEDVSRMTAEKADLEQQLRDARRDLEAMDEHKASSAKHAAAAEQAAAALSQQVAEADRLRDEVAALTQRTADLERQVNEAGARAAEQERAAQALAARLESESAVILQRHADEIASIKATYQAKEACLQSELSTLRGAQEALQAALQSQTEQSNALTTELRTIRENSHVSDNVQLERLCKISLERDEMARKLEEMGDQGRALIDARDEVARLKAELFKAEAQRRKLHNEIQDLRGKVRVCVRVRPPKLNAEAVASLRYAADEKGLGLEYSGTNHSFAFDHVFGPASAQSDVFDEVSHFVQSALDGYNVCLFAYGQTGSGKTHTLTGTLEGDGRGVIPRAAEKIVETGIRMSEHGWVYTFNASYFEIYNETIRDLLAPKSAAPPPKGLTIKTGLENIPEVEGLEVCEVREVEDVLALVRRAEANRSVAGTDMNERSSRSHSVFLLRMSGRHAEKDSVVSGNLYLCDLAGSERLKKSHAEGDRLKETQAINKSLSSLADVFAALKTKSAHVPYRNSKLTHILQPCLSGTGKAFMLVALSPEQDSAHETLCSLRFASQVNQTELGQAKRQVASASAVQPAGSQQGPPTKRPRV